MQTPIFFRSIATRGIILGVATAGLAATTADAVAGSRAPNGGPILVTSCGDDGAPGTLRWALAQASEGDVIDASTLNCGTILLTGGALDIGTAGPHPLAAVTIHGPGHAQLTIDGGAATRVIEHGIAPTDAGALRIEGVTITRGASSDGFAACIRSLGHVELDDVVVSDCHSTSNDGASRGGALAVDGSLSVVSSVIESSSVVAPNGAAAGGGAYVGGDAAIERSRFADNVVTSDLEGAMPDIDAGGGGVHVGGDVSITDSTFAGNTVTEPNSVAYGGAVLGHLMVRAERSAFIGNSAPRGTLVNNSAGPDFSDANGMVVIDSTIAGNQGVYGSGIGASYQLEVANSTVVDNDASLGFGAIYLLVEPDRLRIDSSIISRNTVGGMSSATADIAWVHTALGAPTVDGGHNIIGHAEADIVLPADTLHVDPMLDVLTDNGGPTLTYALLPGSPAHDAGDNALGLATDQRGFPRVSGQATDIGAFETDEGDGIFADGFD